MHVRRPFIGMGILAMAAILGVPAPASADGAASGEHAHGSVPAAAIVTRSTARYVIPDVRLVRQDGATVTLAKELDDGRPVVLTFIYTSCGTVCPLISHTLSQLQGMLGAHRGRAHLMSISIDPEQDTPARLRDYAKTFDAGPEWQHYTGTLAASEAVQRAFDVYRGAKMDHSAAMMVRASPGAPWVRFDGFATAEQLLAELPGPGTLHAAQ